MADTPEDTDKREESPERPSWHGPQVDIAAEMKTAYKTLYNYDLNDADIDGILWTDMQGDATNYAQFKAK